MKLTNSDGHSFSIDIKSGRLTHKTFTELCFDDKGIIAAHSSGPAIDMQGRTVIPGLTDSHVHFIQTGFLYNGGDMSDVQSEDELLQRIAESIAGRTYFQCWGYDPKSSLPTRTKLDIISREIPIFVRRRDGHSSALNTAAINLVADNLTPFDGQYNLDRGFLRSDAHMEAEHIFLNMATPEDLAIARKAVEQRVIPKGVTSVHALVHRKDWVARLEESTGFLELPVFLESWEVEEAIELGLPRIGGCLLLDGSFGSHTAALMEPYLDKKSCGCLYQENEDLLDFVTKANHAGLQTAFHAIGDGAVDQLVRIHRELAGKYPYPIKRHRIEHAEIVPNMHFETIRKLGIILSVQPVFEYLWGGEKGLYNDRLGLRHRITNRYRTLRENGIILTGGSDS